MWADIAKAVAAFLGLLPQLWEFFKNRAQEREVQKQADYISDVGKVFKEINQAKTQEQRFEAAKKLQDLISHL